MLCIILVLLGIFMILGIVKMPNLSNPVFVFNAIWFICFFFYTFNISGTYSNDISVKAGICFIIMILTFNISFALSTISKHTVLKSNIRLIKKKEKYEYIKIVAYTWMIFIFLEIVYCGGVPLIWLLTGKGGTYATFGIPSIHGFINSLSWFFLNIAFSYYLDSKDKRIIKLIICVNIIYFVLLARQSIMTEIIQLVTIYLLKRKVKIKKIILLILAAVIIFGFVGNIRTDPMHVIRTARLQFEDIPMFLMGFVWVYMYMMTPIANIISFINQCSEFNFGLQSLGVFLPTVLTEGLGIGNIIIDNESYLISKTYNVSTALLVPYSDFGVLGIILFVGFMGWLGGKMWRNLRMSLSELNICNYSIYLGILALLFFSNMLLSLPIVVQFFYTNILFKNYFELGSEGNKNAKKNYICNYSGL